MEKEHNFPAPKSAPPRQNRESATSPVEHLVAPVICARCTTLGRLRPRRGFLGPEIGDVMEISCGSMGVNRDLMVIQWILMCL